MDIKGHTVDKVMITTTADIAEEYYFSYLLDRAKRSFLCIASVAGGMEIEQVAHEAPEKVAKVPIDAIRGVDEAAAREIVAEAGFPAEVADQVARHRGEAVARVRGRGRDAGRGQPVGPDAGRDGALPRRQGDARRQRRHSATPSTRRTRTSPPPTNSSGGPRRRTSTTSSWTGEVGIIGNGAGLVMSTLDVVAYAGESHGGVRPANFLDIGGGASAEVMANGLEIVLSDPT